MTTSSGRTFGFSLAVLLAAIIAACTHTVSRPPDSPRPVAFHLCAAGVDLRLEAPGIDGAGGDRIRSMTDNDGNTSFPAVPESIHAFNLFLTSNGDEVSRAAVPLPPGGRDFFLGDCGADVPNRDQVIAGLAVPGLDTGERGRVRVDGLKFVRDDGSTFRWRGVTAFQLYLKWLDGGPGAIRPVVENWLTCGGGCVAQGPNTVRVLMMVNSFAHLWPQEHGEPYYDQIRPFTDYLWTRYHLRVELVLFADAQDIMPDKDQELRHAANVMAAVEGAPNVFVEVANEPFKNIPDGGVRAAEIGRTLLARGPPVASGDYSGDVGLVLDYVTDHTPRDAEWPRKAKDLYDYRDLARRPVVGDEPMGFGEDAGTRSISAPDAAQYAAACAMFSAGCTFHSDAGIAFGPYGPRQADAATQFFRPLHWIVADAQLGPYNRGGEEPGCRWVGESVAQHDDALELRSFATFLGGDGWLVQIRSTRSSPVACPGWVITEQMGPGLAKVRRQ